MRGCRRCWPRPSVAAPPGWCRPRRPHPAAPTAIRTVRPSTLRRAAGRTFSLTVSADHDHVVDVAQAVAHELDHLIRHQARGRLAPHRIDDVKVVSIAHGRLLRFPLRQLGQESQVGRSDRDKVPRLVQHQPGGADMRNGLSGA